MGREFDGSSVVRGHDVGEDLLNSKLRAEVIVVWGSAVGILDSIAVHLDDD